MLARVARAQPLGGRRCRDDLVIDWSNDRLGEGGQGILAGCNAGAVSAPHAVPRLEALVWALSYTLERVGLDVVLERPAAGRTTRQSSQSK